MRYIYSWVLKAVRLYISVERVFVCNVQGCGSFPSTTETGQRGKDVYEWFATAES